MFSTFCLRAVAMSDGPLFFCCFSHHLFLLDLIQIIRLARSADLP
ncbi:hypothetical protein BN137_3649 [Cronobacter condimenti 1330]|uniref:Uncharacterized protein n=1 Tax=Cronobacter condimenti 1330 TaxID=1073999 RepID=K8A371_9ENTR|nr:hypothetical protein BN137_3649 [Cronobacter condimenti 1330]